MPDRIDPDIASMPMFVLRQRYRRISVSFHAHRRIQLIHVSDGTLTVATRMRQWTIPPQRGVWIASGTLHRIASATPFTLTTCYAERGWLGPVKEGLVAVDHLTSWSFPPLKLTGIGQRSAASSVSSTTASQAFPDRNRGLRWQARVLLRS